MVIYYNKKLEVRKKKQDGSFSPTIITLTDFSREDVRIGSGNRKDTLSVRMGMSKNSLQETYYSGDGSTTDFTLDYEPDSEFLQGGNKKVFVFISGILQAYATDYTISGSTLSFTSAPSSGSDNIKVAFNVIETGDLIKLYKAKNKDSLTGDDILIEATVENPSVKINQNKGGMFTVKAVGLIENIFSALVFVKDVSLTKPEEIIQECITQINNYNRLKTIYGEDSDEWSDIGNDTTSSNVQYTASYKSALEIIEEVSSDRYTKQGNYFYYAEYNKRSGITDGTTTNKLVDSTADFSSGLVGNRVYNEINSSTAIINAVDSSTQLSLSSDIFVSGEAYSIPTYDFHWNAKTQELGSNEIVEGEGGLKSLKIGRDRGEVINAIIYNVGLDCYETPQEFPNFANTSMAGQGTKWRYIMSTNTIISDLLNQEFEADPSEWDTGANGNRTSNFPTDIDNDWLDADGDWDFQFETRNDDGTKSGTNASATTNKTFNDAIVEEAKWVGKEVTDHILNLKQAPRIKAEATYPFTTDFTIGELVPVTCKQFNLKTYPLRIVEIRYNEDDVTLYLKEDEFTAIERLIEGS